MTLAIHLSIVVTTPALYSVISRNCLWVALVLNLALPGAATAQASAPDDVPTLVAKARADSNDPIAHFALAVAYLEKKQYAEGEAALHEAIAIDPQFAPGYFYLSAIPRKRSVHRILANWRGMPEAITVIGDDSVARESRRLAHVAFLLNPMLDLGRPTRWEIPLAWAGGTAQAMDDFREGRFQQAYDRLTDLMARSSGKSDSVAAIFIWYHALSAAHLSLFDIAIKDVDRLRLRAEHNASLQMAFARTPRSADDYTFVVAFVQQIAGHREDAIQAYQELLERNIGVYTAHIRLAEIHEQQQDWPLAVEERQRAVATNPEDPSLVFDLGATLQRAGRNAEAVPELSRSIELNPRETLAYYALGVADLALGRSAEARVALQQFIALAPSRYQSQIFDAKWRLAQSP